MQGSIQKYLIERRRAREILCQQVAVVRYGNLISRGDNTGRPSSYAYDAIAMLPLIR